MIFGERGGTRTLDPMIKSYVLGAPPLISVRLSPYQYETRPISINVTIAVVISQGMSVRLNGVMAVRILFLLLNSYAGG